MKFNIPNQKIGAALPTGCTAVPVHAATARLAAPPVYRPTSPVQPRIPSAPPVYRPVCQLQTLAIRSLPGVVQRTTSTHARERADERVVDIADVKRRGQKWDFIYAGTGKKQIGYTLPFPGGGFDLVVCDPSTGTAITTFTRYDGTPTDYMALRSGVKLSKITVPKPVSLPSLKSEEKAKGPPPKPKSTWTGWGKPPGKPPGTT